MTRLLLRRSLVLRLAVFVGVAAGAAIGALLAFSYFSSTAPAQTNAVNAALIPQGNQPSASSSSNNPTVTFTFQTVSVASTQLTSYDVTRYDANTTASTALSFSSCSLAGTTVTCTDTPGDGQWRYTDTPKFNSWIGTESATSVAVTVSVANHFTLTAAPAPPP